MTRLGTRWPEAIVTGLVGLSLAAATTVSLGIHRPWTTLPLAAIITVALWRSVRPDPDPDPPQRARMATRCVLGGTLAWVTLGIVLASQYLVVMRDPGFLALSGVWLTDHPSTDIPTAGAIEAAATQANLLPDAWQAWNLHGTVVQPQGAKMLPAVLSVGGWIAGVPGVLAVNIVIGGVGILALYVLARRWLGPLAALGPAAVLALTVSHQSLSRSPYSEPLTLVLIVASITWALRGLEQRRAGALIAAGVASGATALVRIDGAAYAVGVLVGAAAAALVMGRVRGLVAAFAAAQAATVGAGYASLAVWSWAYLERLGGQARTLGTAYGAVLIVVVVVLAVWSPQIRERTRRALWAHRAVLGRWAAGVVVVLAVVLASRPVWMTDRRGTASDTDQFTNTVVEAFQQAEGYPVDATRTYAEHTVTWLSYYLTWPVLALAVIGMAVLTHQALTRRAPDAVVLGAFAAPTALYLVKPEIVPDQLWAIRRFEPITLPLVALAAAVGVWWCAHQVTARRGEQMATRMAMLSTAALVVPILSTWVSLRPGDDHPIGVAIYAFTREQAGARAIADSLCTAVGDSPVVLVGSSQYYGTVRVMCDVPVVLALETPTADALAQMAQVWHRPPVVITQDSSLFDPLARPIITGTIDRGEYALQHMPRLTNRHEEKWFVADVTADGTLVARPAVNRD